MLSLGKRSGVAKVGWKYLGLNNIEHVLYAIEHIMKSTNMSYNIKIQYNVSRIHIVFK